MSVADAAQSLRKAIEHLDKAAEALEESPFYSFHGRSFRRTIIRKRTSLAELADDLLDHEAKVNKRRGR